MTIRLQQVIQAIEEADDVFTSFWDTKTGETVYLADSLMTGEMDETFAAEIENAPERYLRFPSKHEIHQYRIMRTSLISSLPERHRKNLPIPSGEKVRFAGSSSRCAIMGWNSVGTTIWRRHTESLRSAGVRRKVWST